MRSQNCSSNDPCSSSCQCFDGKNEQMDNTEEFNFDGIEGQGEMAIQTCIVLIWSGQSQLC